MNTPSQPPSFFRHVLGVAALAACAATSCADVTLAPLFRNGAVLQRDRPLPIWGQASAGEKIRVQFHNQSVETTASAVGAWRVTLAAEKAAAQPADLVVTGTNVVRVSDVLVGDVWLCSGQSNMEFRLSQASDGEKEVAVANLPLIRQFKIPHTVAGAPVVTCAGEWKTCTPETAGDFTAVGYFFARDLQQRLGVPIGLVNSSWGGTQIESWISLGALQADPSVQVITERWQKVLRDHPAKLAIHAKALAKWEADAAAAKTAARPFSRRAPRAPEGPGSRWQPAGLYNAMIAPLAPAALRGVLWYQGEGNGARGGEYRTLFPTLIRQWRGDFEQQDLPFYFVQLANFERKVDKTDQQWAFLREAQALALALPDTGMAVTIDIGNPTDVHPTNKKDVGERLARLARAEIFGEEIETAGPVFAGAKTETGAMRVTFSHASGLWLKPAASVAMSFEVAGENRKFVPAVAVVSGEALLVSAATVPAPVAVRYAWRNSPDARLFNSAGLPAAPFRSDDWR